MLCPCSYQMLTFNQRYNYIYAKHRWYSSIQLNRTDIALAQTIWGVHDANVQFGCYLFYQLYPTS